MEYLLQSSLFYLLMIQPIKSDVLMETHVRIVTFLTNIKVLTCSTVIPNVFDRLSVANITFETDKYVLSKGLAVTVLFLIGSVRK